jgi:hypothetical protein
MWMNSCVCLSSVYEDWFVDRCSAIFEFRNTFELGKNQFEREKETIIFSIWQWLFRNGFLNISSVVGTGNPVYLFCVGFSKYESYAKVFQSCINGDISLRTYIHNFYYFLWGTPERKWGWPPRPKTSCEGLRNENGVGRRAQKQHKLFSTCFSGGGNNKQQ